MNLKLLQRVTSSGKTIQYIDGLRFFAVMSVFFFHFLDYYEDLHQTVPKIYQPFKPLFGNAFNGVTLFFAISGFVLALPFIKQYVYKEKKVSLKKYFFRRITRLEPPYLILLTFFFLYNIFISAEYTFTELFPHFAASFFYLHHAIFQEYPILNTVLWTLEIEVQFYLLAPLIAKIFMLPKIPRRLLLILSIIFYSSIYQWVPKLPFKNILDFLPYFLVGFLAVDIYLDYKDKWKPNYLFDILCLISIFCVWTDYLDVFYLYFLFIVLSFSPFTKVWHKVLKNPYLIIIGGMCYTLYMLHLKIIYIVTEKVLKNEINNFELDFLLRLSIALFSTLLFSSIFFMFVERPTMKREWWKYKSFKKLFFE